MPTAWAGADPAEIADSIDYELGTEWVAVETITITGIRIHTGAGEVGQAGRKARLWTAAGVELSSVTLPSDLPTGWSTHTLDTAVTRNAAQRFVSSYSTYGNYSALADALGSDVPSADGAITALASAGSTNGNGVFNQNNPASFPATASPSSAFYGVDVEYSLGAGGNTAPRITALTAVAAGATVTATMTVEDDETLIGALYRIDWGDGTATTGATTAQHTYSASELYAVLASVTDAGGLADHEATAVDVTVPDSDVQEIDSQGIVDVVVSHALALGLFDSVNSHEPAREPPRSGLTASVWVQSIGPVSAASGLRLTSARLALSVRLYRHLDGAPRDEIDPAMLSAVDRLLAAYSGHFQLGGAVRNVDLLGGHGPGLGAEAGYLEIGAALYRVMTVTLPLILNDVWEQVP